MTYPSGSGKTTVVRHGGGETIDVPRAQFLAPVREGDVLRVTLGTDGRLDWASAEADEELRQERLALARDVLEEVKKRDPSGDVVL